MSILIHGVSMPKAGLARNISIFEDGSVIYYGGSRVIGKAIELPPHGRLIDVDILLKSILSIVLQRSDDPKKVTINANTLLQLVDSLPTVLPADPADGGDAQ